MEEDKAASQAKLYDPIPKAEIGSANKMLVLSGEAECLFWDERRLNL
jgi:hypothetical protein